MAAFLTKIGVRSNIPANIKERQLILHNLPAGVDGDTVLLFLERNDLSGGGPVRELKMDKENNRALVTFENSKDAKRLLKRRRLFMGLQVLKIIGYPPQCRNITSNHEAKVIISGISGTTTEYTIWLYFENNTRSRGGDIVDISFLPDKGVAVITFKSTSAARRVLSNSDLVLDNVILMAHPWTQNILHQLGIVENQTQEEEVERLFTVLDPKSALPVFTWTLTHLDNVSKGLGEEITTAQFSLNTANDADVCNVDKRPQDNVTNERKMFAQESTTQGRPNITDQTKRHSGSSDQYTRTKHPPCLRQAYSSPDASNYGSSLPYNFSYPKSLADIEGNTSSPASQESLVVTGESHMTHDESMQDASAQVLKAAYQSSPNVFTWNNTSKGSLKVCDVSCNLCDRPWQKPMKIIIGSEQMATIETVSYMEDSDSVADDVVAHTCDPENRSSTDFFQYPKVLGRDDLNSLSRKGTVLNHSSHLVRTLGVTEGDITRAESKHRDRSAVVLDCLISWKEKNTTRATAHEFFKSLWELDIRKVDDMKESIERLTLHDAKFVALDDTDESTATDAACIQVTPTVISSSSRASSTRLEILFHTDRYNLPRSSVKELHIKQNGRSVALLFNKQGN